MTERMPVGVIVERRKAANPWDDYVWCAVDVVVGMPAKAPWSILHETPDATRLFAGSVEIELHPRETGLYRANLRAEKPAVFVVLHPDPSPPGLALRHVTVSPGDAEAYMDGVHIVDPVPMPTLIARWLEDYVAAYHVEETFHKRRRSEQT